MQAEDGSEHLKHEARVVLSAYCGAAVGAKTTDRLRKEAALQF